MNEMLRTVLELIGLRESPRAMMQRKLRLVSQSKTPGRATLVVKSLGMKQNSAISALREITDLPRTDIIALAGMLPLPLLTHVSMETAVAAQKILALIGVESEIVSPDTIPPASQQPAVRETAVSTPRARKPFAVQPGSYTVTLTAVGLLGERVREGVQRITGRAMGDTAVLEAALPLTLLTGVDEETAVRAQTSLQMVGAVVDIDDDGDTV
ncbi:MAG: hypothetical protein IAE79_11655 [Anaerolinea sp.]|nr:hypothetical protein [Anaerolinea sp.]